MSDLLTHIMDLDGFTVGKAFLCKDMAIIPVKRNATAISANFALGRTYDSLSRRDQTTANYLTKFLHGLHFNDLGIVELDQRDLADAIETATSDCNEPLIGYKGGHYERDILTDLGIPSVNIESIGCPKFDQLILEPKYRQSGSTKPQCRLHKSLSTGPNKRHFHCPTYEVTVFRDWYLDTKPHF